MVVDVVLALHAVAGVLHHAAEGVAKRSPAAVANVERAHGIGRDELDLDLLARADVRAAKVVALLAHGAEDLVVGRGREVEVHEAGACDLDLGDARVGRHVVHDCLGDGAGRHVCETSGA